MKKILLLIAICFTMAFAAEKTVKIELSITEVNTLIDGLRKSRLESWQANALIDKITIQANQQLDTTKKR